MSSVSAADLDGDGDVDLLSTSYHDWRLAWEENLGDPCATNPCQNGGACTNPGVGAGHECDCTATGFTRDNCEIDIDECGLGTDNCHADATCGNAPGRFSCDCRPGYSGDGTDSVDDDECTAGTHTCDQNAICTNTPGSFDCTCRAGLLGDGTVCSEAPQQVVRGRGCACNSGILDASGVSFLGVAMLLRLARRRRGTSRSSS